MWRKDDMTLSEIGVLVTIVLGVTGAFGVMYRYFISKISSAEIIADKKIARIYERFDEYKQNIESKFVYREMCKVLHDNNSSNFSKLETRMEEGFKAIDAKLSELQKLYLNNK